jgi:hypothetical protein
MLALSFKHLKVVVPSLENWLLKTGTALGKVGTIGGRYLLAPHPGVCFRLT